MLKSPRRTHSTSCNARGATSAASDQLIVSSDDAGNNDDDGEDYDDDDTDHDDDDDYDDVMMIMVEGIGVLCQSSLRLFSKQRRHRIFSVC